MAGSKAAKRKRAAQATLPQKILKTQSAITPPPDGDNVHPKTLQTVISDEELEITVETLTTLAQYPGLIKSKQCKDLRSAVYDFRQACTMGTNSATSGTNLTGRITGALADQKYVDAKILLAEMKIRGQEPKLGALCRWVRDLDFVSGLSTQAAGAKDTELISVLDDILRVSCPVDTNLEAVVNTASPLAPQATWDVGTGSAAKEQVYASVLDKSILSYLPESTTNLLRVIGTTDGALRKPPNHHPEILYTSATGTIPLTPDFPDITYHKHPKVPGLGLAAGVLSPAECKAIIAAGESVNFLPDSPIRQDGDISVLAHNFYWIVDTDFHDKLWKRVSPFVPSTVEGRQVRGLNRRFRVYRYVPGAEYRCHIDGAWPPSGITAEDKYVYDDSPPEKKQSSLFTFLMYLNDEFEGGETTFFLPGARQGTINAYPVRPVMGGVAMFPHGDARGALLHEGTGVRKGAKYVIRTDVEYDIEPSGQV